MSVLILISLVASCSGVEFSSRVQNFSIELMYFTHLHFDNFVLSPFCVWSAMICVDDGSSGNTKKQIRQAFILPANKTKFYDDYKSFKGSIFDKKTTGVELAYGMFVFGDFDLRLRKVYLAKLSEYHGARTKFLKDMQTASSLANSYITSHFPSITNVFHADDFAESAMIISNVIHFKGTWTIPFNRSSTTEETIYNETNSAVGSVTMMRQTARVPYSNFESMKAHIMELSYGVDNKMCVLIILPYPGITASYVYSQLEKVFLTDIFDKLQKDIDLYGLKEVEVKLPKIRIATSATLNKPLNDMGVFDAFEPDYATFIGISSEDIYVNTVEQKAEISFEETETVATATIPGYFDKVRPVTGYKAKQPFIFFIIEKPTLTILYSGIYSHHYYLNSLSSHIIFNDD